MGTTALHRITISEALFTRTQQRVLGILFAEPDRSFFASEIFRRAATGRGSVQRELERLEASGLVKVRRVGNQKHYQANPAAPVFNELRSIVLKTGGLADPIGKALQPLRKKIELALIYGSVARNEAHAGSDVDLLVVARNVTLEALYRRLASAEKIVGRRIQPTLYTPEEFRQRRHSSSFVQKVLAGPVITLIGNTDAEEGAR